MKVSEAWGTQRRFWTVPMWRVVYWRFERTYCVHLRGGRRGRESNCFLGLLFDHIHGSSIFFETAVNSYQTTRYYDWENSNLEVTTNSDLAVANACPKFWETMQPKCNCHNNKKQTPWLLFLSSSSLIALTRLSGPRSRPTTSQKIW
jgi:hypothetical protein